MTARTRRSVDLAAIRADHPLEEIVAASGVELIRRGHGYMARCPFHHDSTASLSVGGVRDRFHCFGCGASGDVIDYVRRLEGLSFLESVHALEAGSPFPDRPSLPAHASSGPAPIPRFTTPAPRVYDINDLAWQYFTQPEHLQRAEAYLRNQRGIDVTDLRAATGGAPIAGYAPKAWRGLTNHLQERGVTDTELRDADLGQRTRRGELVDSQLGRLVVPVHSEGGRIAGFIGRDLTGDPRAPKYRNPTRTPTFDKSTGLYRPTQHPLAPDATVVVVEGVLDALAIAATAAQGGRSEQFAPCTTSGVTVSPAQAAQVLALHPRPAVIALDGDTAGAEGTLRWVDAVCRHRHRPALVTRLPEGQDPADWLAAHGPEGLAAFDRSTSLTGGADTVHPRLPGQEIARLCVETADEPVHQAIVVLVPLALQLPPDATDQLVSGAVNEMTVRGWNPDQAFTHALSSAIAQAQRRRQALHEGPGRGAANGPEVAVHTFPFAGSPSLA